MNRVDDDWLLAMTQVEYRAPLRVIRLADREDNYDQRTGRRGGPFDQPTMRGAAENPWRATVRLPRERAGWADVAGNVPTISARGPTPLAAMQSCWARLVSHMMRYPDVAGMEVE